MRTAYVDDEPLYEDQLRNALRKNHIDDDFDFYSDPDSFLKNSARYDVVILDIQLAQESGINLARKLHQEQPAIIVVFLTNYPGTVFDAFGLNVFSFIDKTRLEEKIGNCWTMLKKELSMAQTVSLTIYGGHTVAVNPGSILFFETFQKKIKVYMDNGTVYSLARQSMNSLKELLDNSFFEYASRSVIVNIQKIKSVESDCIKIQGYGKPIYTSRTRHAEIYSKFMKYHSR